MQEHDAKWRKERPLARGVLSYFPDALLEVANVSFVGSQQHQPGEPMRWDKAKSPDHADCLLRHLGERGTTDTDGLLHTAKVAWRALALLQTEIEEGRKQTLIDDEILGTQKQAVYDDPMDEVVALGQRIQPEAYVTYTSSFGDLVDSSDPHRPRKRLKCYLAGPMRGIKGFNFPAFDHARDILKRYWDVISPADMDREQGHTDNRGYAKRDTKAILECDAIYMLKGWEKSVGATAEHALAKWAELTIFYQEEK